MRAEDSVNALISLRSFNIAAVAGAVLLCAAAIFAQDRAMSPYQNERDGVSAGGKWMQFESQDKMTGAKRVRFELLAENYLREDPQYKPRIELFCEDGKLKLAKHTHAHQINRRALAQIIQEGTTDHTDVTE